jgi:carboxylesterase
LQPFYNAIIRNLTGEHLMIDNPMIHNPHLQGETFFWNGGPVGILLSHGYTASTAEVRLLARLLHEQGYTVAGPLLPGHMTSPEDMNRCRWQDWVGSMEVAYQEIAAQCEVVFIGGESMGALVALHVAGQHPEIAGLLIYAPAMRIARQKAMVANLLYRFVPYVNKQRIEPAHLWQGYTVNPVPALVQMLKLQDEIRQQLPFIHQPLLLVQGRLDTDIDLRGVETIYQEIGSDIKELYWMEHSIHTVIMDHELDQVYQVTQQFIEKTLLRAPTLNTL